MDGLVAEDIVVRFGGRIAVDHLTVHAPRGRITGLIGPNGAGKTTSFNVCGGFLRPDTGRVLLDGQDITKAGPDARARLGIGRTFQRMELFRSMTVRENIEIAAEAAHIGNDPFTQLGLIRHARRQRHTTRERAAELLDRVGITSIAGTIAGRLSTGQGRMVELARALATEPRILLLDEPSSGLDQSESEAFGALLTGLVTEGDLGILMVEHDVNLVLSVCAWIHVIDFGKPLFAGDPVEVRNSDVVRNAYLGSAA